ncbi:MAG: type II toxin-antitoxin system RelE/ParE family toxin [Devosia sp.]|nr:type II toxin-antitoxin system RelE/ParE family toxin [Devosia sp.]
MRVLFSRASRRDMRDIALYIAADNPVRAHSFLGEMEEACRLLANKPYRFGLLPNYETRGLRRRPFDRYVIIYGVDEDHVIIHRIANAALDLDSLLKTLER